MEIENIQREHKPDKRKVSISIRITKKHSEFMKEKNISPTKLFIKSLEELMKNKN